MEGGRGGSKGRRWLVNATMTNVHMVKVIEGYLELGRQNAGNLGLTELLSSSHRCPHRPSSRGFVPGVRHTFSAFLIGSLLRPFLVCMTLLHRYCPCLWSPELPQMHVEH